MLMPPGTAPLEGLPLVTDSPDVRVHISSQQPIIRAGIQCLLAAHTDTVKFVADPHCSPPDVVIYDVFGLHLDHGHDLELTVQRHPGRVLALSRALQPGPTARALDLGAVAAIPISADAAELLTAIRAAVDGQFQDGSVIGVANQWERDRLLGRDVNLSPREREILAMIVAGASNLDITLELNLTPNSVKSMIRNAYLKIGVATRAQAVAWGVEHGFPTTPPEV
jgi:DNA-binding NarL/FixJ family response regulator